MKAVRLKEDSDKTVVRQKRDSSKGLNIANIPPKVWSFRKLIVNLPSNIEIMAFRTKQSSARKKKESKMIFAASCIESAARQRNISTSEMYLRMKRVGLMDGFILKCYDGLHTQSRAHVTEDVLGALDIWEAKQAEK